jgi:predicted dinucleotide-binding enzyme
VLFIASDNLEAKAVVSRLIEEIGFVTVDMGSLRDGGRKQQPDSPIYNNPTMTDRAGEMLETRWADPAHVRREQRTREEATR